MARLDRDNKKPNIVHKVKHRSKSITQTLRKLLIVNLLLTALSCVGNYDKYIELSKKLIEFLRLLT